MLSLPLLPQYFLDGLCHILEQHNSTFYDYRGVEFAGGMPSYEHGL